MKKSFIQIAKTTTEYTREIVFDSDHKSLWYEFDEEARKMGLVWSDLDQIRQDLILSKFKSFLSVLEKDFNESPDVDRGWERWDKEVEVIEIN